MKSFLEWIFKLFYFGWKLCQVALYKISFIRWFTESQIPVCPVWNRKQEKRDLLPDIQLLPLYYDENVCILKIAACYIETNVTMKTWRHYIWNAITFHTQVKHLNFILSSHTTKEQFTNKLSSLNKF